MSPGDATPTPRRSPPPGRRRLGRTLHRAVLLELAPPTLLALCAVTLLVLAVDLVVYADFVINRGFAAGDVARIALYRTLPMLGRAMPFAVLLGTLIALGRLGAHREILAIEASGIQPRALVLPVLALAACFVAGGAAISLVGAPAANRRLEALVHTLALGRSGEGAPLRPGVVERFGDWRLVAREVSPHGDALRGVVLWAPPLGGTVFAERVRLASPPAARGPGGLPVGRELLIENGVVVATLSGAPSQARFGRMQAELEAPPGDREGLLDWASVASLGELRAAARAGQDRKRLRQAQHEWQERLALPLASAVFALLAVPLSIARARPSPASGVALGLAAAAVYYGLVQLASGLARAPELPVAATVWLPNAALAAAAGLLLAAAPRWRIGRKPWRAAAAAARPAPPLRLHALALDRYVVRTFAGTGLLCLAALLAAYLAIDVLDNLKWFTKYRSTPDEVLRFYAARLPLLASRVVPMALLLGAAFTLSLLGMHGELIGMRACGVPTLRVVMPVLVACGAVALAYFPLVNDLVPRANARASRIKQTEIKDRSDVRLSVWSLSGDRLLQAERLDPIAGLASRLSVYELDETGLPHARIDARGARHVGDGVWRLTDPVRFDLDATSMREVPAEPFLVLGKDAAVEVEGENLPLAELREEIQTLEARGYDATPFRVDLMLKLAAPLGCLLLPALALLYAAGGPPFPTPVQTLVASALAAGGWVLLTAVGASLGYGGALPPWLAAFGPVVASILAAGLLAGRLHGFGRGS
jgi:LPS export ABC transporter permease LptG